MHSILLEALELIYLHFANRNIGHQELKQAIQILHY